MLYGTGNGADNTGVGTRALGANTTGVKNTSVGSQALVSNTTGSQNTAVGYQALNSPQTAFYNTAMGERAGQYATGDQNVYVGYACAIGDSGGHSGNANVIIGGGGAFFSATTANSNVGIGYEALYATTTGQYNTTVGRQAGRGVQGGSYNTFLGASAGYDVTSGSKNTIVGRFDGNQDSLNITTDSKNCVLSDGDGVPQFRTWYEDTDSINQKQALVPRGFMTGKGATNTGLTAYLSVSDNSASTRARFAVGSVTSQYDTGHLFITISGIGGGATNNHAAWYYYSYAVYNRGVGYITLRDSGGSTGNITITITDQGDSTLDSNGIVLQVAGSTGSGNTIAMNVQCTHYRNIYASWRN